MDGPSQSQRETDTHFSCWGEKIMLVKTKICQSGLEIYITYHNQIKILSVLLVLFLGGILYNKICSHIPSFFFFVPLSFSVPPSFLLLHSCCYIIFFNVFIKAPKKFYNTVWHLEIVLCIKVVVLSLSLSWLIY